MIVAQDYNSRPFHQITTCTRKNSFHGKRDFVSPFVNSPTGQPGMRRVLGIANRKPYDMFADIPGIVPIRIALLLAATTLVLQSGCVHRRMTVRTDPPGALLMVNGQPKGFTPASTDFEYYGTNEITLVKDGYETVKTLQPVPKPWYQWFPIEFISDNLLPFKVTNRHDFTYRLQPQHIVPREELTDRANATRSEAQISQ